MVVEVMLGVAHHERVSVAEISVDHLPPLWKIAEFSDILTKRGQKQPFQMQMRGWALSEI
jgi:hypothetical protein